MYWLCSPQFTFSTCMCKTRVGEYVQQFKISFLLRNVVWSRTLKWDLYAYTQPNHGVWLLCWLGLKWVNWWCFFLFFFINSGLHVVICVNTVREFTQPLLFRRISTRIPLTSIFFFPNPCMCRKIFLSTHFSRAKKERSVVELVTKVCRCNNHLLIVFIVHSVSQHRTTRAFFPSCMKFELWIFFYSVDCL